MYDNGTPGDESDDKIINARFERFDSLNA